MHTALPDLYETFPHGAALCWFSLGTGGEGLCVAGGGALARATVPALPKASPTVRSKVPGLLEPVSQDGPRWDVQRVEPVQPVSPLQAWWWGFSAPALAGFC